MQHSPEKVKEEEKKKERKKEQCNVRPEKEKRREKNENVCGEESRGRDIKRRLTCVALTVGPCTWV